MNHHSGSASTFSTGTQQPEAPTSPASPLVRAALLALAYFLLTLPVLWLSSAPGHTLPLWPAAGLALAALGVWGWRLWPGVWLGAFAAEWLHQVHITSFYETTAMLSPALLTQSALISSGDALQAVLGALLVRRLLRATQPLGSERAALAFLALGGPLACLTAATVGVTTLHFFGQLPSRALAANWLTWWAGDSLGVLLFAPLTLLLLPESRRHWRGHARWIAGPILIASLLIVAGYAWLLQTESDAHRDRLSTNAMDLQNRLENALYQRRARLRSIEGLFEADAHVTLGQFDRFNRLTTNHTGVEEIEWAPRVAHTERAALETVAWRAGLTDFVLREPGANQVLVVAADRADYYPLWFATDPSARRPIGLDLGAHAANRAAMVRAAETTRPALVAHEALLDPNGGGANWRLLVPIYQPGFDAQPADPARRRDALRGFAVAALNPQQMWVPEIEHAAREGLVLRIQSLADWNPAQPLLAGALPAGREARPDWSAVMGDFAGPGLKLEVWSINPWVPTQSPAMPLYYGGAVLLALLTGVLTFGSAGQQRRMAREIARRTVSEGRLVALVENVQVGVLVYDRHAVILSANSTAQELLRRSASELVGSKAEQRSGLFLREDGSHPAMDEYPVYQVLARRQPVHGIVVGFQFPGASSTTWTMSSAAPLFDANGELSEVVVSFMDISARKRLEERERSRSRIMAAIGSEASLGAILELIARAVETEDPQASCSILLLDAGGKHLRLGAAPSLPACYNQAVDGLEVGPNASACGQAAFTGQRVIAADLENDPLWLPFRELARQAGLGSCWSEPIISSNGVVLGTFAIYHRQACEPGADDSELIGMAAELARLAIERKRAQARILQLNAELERRVAERTAALMQANADLQDSATRIRAILDTMADAVITIDEHGTVETINPAAERLFGYASAELIGQNVSLLMPEPYHGEHDGYLTRYQATGEARVIGIGREVEGLRKDGSTFPLELAVSEMRLDEVRRYTGVVRDITERRAGERATRYLQEAVQAISEGFAIFDAEDRLTLWNSKYLGLYNLGADEASVGKTFEAFLREGLARGNFVAALGREEAWLAERLAAHRNPGAPFEQQLPDGRWLRISEVRLSDGSIAGLRSDITELKRAQRAAQEAQAAAEAANRVKSEFLATMSHEIRTPMNGVIGMVDVLQQTSLKGYQVEMVDTIRESAFALLAIIDDVLDFSKIEAGKLELESAPVSVAAVVEKVCDMLAPLAVRKEVELTLFTDPALPPFILGDAQRLRQIVINLSNNAVKFCSEQGRPGRVALRAELVERGPERAVVQIRVIDNGIGMDAATQARLFTAFSQADASTTRRFGGTGLGLAIAHDLAQLMGGDITVQSAPGAGATFTLSLPCVALAEPAAGAATVAPLAGLGCLVVGATGKDSVANDLAVYLAHGGAGVERAADLAVLRLSMATLAPGSWVVVLDDKATEVLAPVLPQVLSPLPSVERVREKAVWWGDLLDELRAARPDLDLRCVIVSRGKRRRARWLDAERRIWALDANALTRQGLLKAVAITAGRLPEEAQSTAVGKSAAALLAPSRDQAVRQGRLILVAEDNLTNQKVIVQQLALLGYAADVTPDGRAALERWRSGDHALLLTDLHMPELDGYELAGAIRAAESVSQSGARRIAIIAITANALKGEAQRCLDAGMDGYLSKPTPLAELKAMLAKWLPAAGAQLPPSPLPSPASRRGSDSQSPALPPRPLGGEGLPALDVRVLAALVGDDPATLREFLLDFRASAKMIAAELAAACEAGNTKEAGALAHKLKSSARAVGALKLGELCAEIEEAGKAGQAAALTDLCSRFEAEMAAVDATLHQHDAP